MADARALRVSHAPSKGPARSAWSRVLSLADEGFAARAFPLATPITFETLLLAPCRRLCADEASERAGRHAGGAESTLLVTALDLRLPDIEWVIGYANRRHRAAVVSIARLCDARDDATTLRRLRNVAAHESGHLHGLSHCRDEGCVMHSATGAASVDRRSGQGCAACRRVLQRSATWAQRIGRWLPERANP